MSDIAATRERCRELEARLSRGPHWPELRAIYLDLSTVVGQLQGAVAEHRRARAEPSGNAPLEETLERLKSELRVIGFNIRLSSEGALAVGLQTAVEDALAILGLLEQH
ncbi:MAG TPA: hypothetical protein VKX16_15600 [Chloroflexota bacterium]|nr:hypothetical protein [Chloroflexota bacterium]